MGSYKPFVITILVLLLIIAGMGGYIGFGIYKEKQEEENTITVIDDVSVNLNIFYQIGDTLNKFDSAFNDTNSNYAGYLYNQDRLLASKFDGHAALFAAVYDDLVCNNTTQYILGARVKNNFEKIFGSNLTYAPGNINAGQYYNINYDKNSNTFSYTAQNVNKVYSPGYISKTIKTTLENGQVTVIRKVFYVEYGSNSGGTDITKAIIYKKSNKQQKIGEVNLINNELNENEVIGKFGSKLLTYKYIFKENKVDDYSFYSLELEK